MGVNKFYLKFLALVGNMSPRKIIWGSLMVMLSSEGFLSQIKCFNILSFYLEFRKLFQDQQ